MGVKKAEGIVPMDGRLIGTDISRYKVVRKNWFAYNPMRLNIGSIARWSNERDVLVSPDYVVFRCLEEPTCAIDPEFLDHFRPSDQWEHFVTRSGIGSVRVRIYYKDIARLPLKLPQLPEQRKIAACLTSLDDVISAQGRKVMALKTHKHGLLQELFPREGETLPRFRFPTFRDGPEWDGTTLGQILDFQSGGTPSKANPDYWHGSIPWVSAKDMKRLFLEDTEDHITTAAVDDGAKLAPSGTVLVLTRGMTLLNDLPICVLRREMSFNQDIKALLPKGDLDGHFLPYLLQGHKQRLLRMVDLAGHGTGRLNTDALMALDVMLPRPPEQRQIADCLYSLEVLIPAESEKLDALRALKSGLLQTLLPTAEADQ